MIDKSCKTFTVELTHSGSLPKNVMGHNWVLTSAADTQAVATDGMAAGLDKNYLKDGDERIIAHTKVIGAGEKDAVSFDVSKLKAGTDYAFFCSFPGHISMMKRHCGRQVRPHYRSSGASPLPTFDRILIWELGQLWEGACPRWLPHNQHNTIWFTSRRKRHDPLVLGLAIRLANDPERFFPHRASPCRNASISA